MNKLSALGVIAVTLAVGWAVAQPGPGATPASAPGGGMGYGPGPGPRWGEGVTPGWSLMTPEERAAHQKAMREAKTLEECRILRDQHRQMMAERAKQRGQALPAQPPRDACAGMTQ